MRKNTTLRKWLLTLLLINCAVAAFTSTASAQDEPELFVYYQSETEEKVVIICHLPELDLTRVYTKSELEDIAPVKEYSFAAVDTGFKLLHYTVSGISLWKVFENAGIPREQYRNVDNYLYTVSQDGAVNGRGKVVGIGKDLSIPVPDMVFATPTGSLSADRYTYPINEFSAYDLSHPQEEDWVLGFAEGRVDLVIDYFGQVFAPVPAENTSYALRTYFGQTDMMQYNNLLYNNRVYRIVLTDNILTDDQARNSHEGSALFSLLGKNLDRANIMSGPTGEAEKFKGRFSSGGITIHIEGTSVASLLAGKYDNWEYVLFTTGSGQQLIVPLQDITDCDYMLVYATGPAAGQLTQIDGFDLYRDGGEPLRNVVAVDFTNQPPVDPPQEEPVLSVYQNGNLLHTFTERDIALLQSTEGLSELKYAVVGSNRQEFHDVSGLTLEQLLHSAGVSGLAANTLVRLQNSQGLARDFTAHQLLTQPRYFFDAGSAHPAQPAPSLISFGQGGNTGRFYIGQASATEPTSSALLEQMRGASVIIGGSAGQHPLPQAQPPGGSVTQGQEIQLSGAQGQAFIYYTLDGSTPTLSSALYQDGTPLTAPSASGFTLKARIIGFGKEDGNIAGFVYNNGGNSSSGNTGSASGGNQGDSSGNTHEKATIQPAVPPQTTTAITDGATPSASASAQQPLVFTDVPAGSYYYDSLRFVLEKGLFIGYKDGSFQPEAVLSRAMAVTVLWRFAEHPPGDQHGFTDVFSGDYFAEAVAWAVENDLVLGNGEASFAPHQDISREQFVLMLYRYAELSGYLPQATADLPPFSDKNAISPYSREAMTWAVETGLIKGMSADLLQPQTPLNRAQAAVILQRFALWAEATAV